MTRQYKEKNSGPAAADRLAIEAEPETVDLYDEPGMEDGRKAHDKPPLYTDTLLEVFGFSYHDLDANRRKRLTGPQKTLMQQDLKEEGDSAWLLMTITLGVTLLLALIFLAEGIPVSSLVPGAGVFLAALMFFAYRRQMTRRDDMVKPEVMQVKGFPRILHGRNVDTSRGSFMVIEDQAFGLTPEQYDELTRYDLPEVIAYYTGRTKRLLSVEVAPQYEDKNKVEHLTLENAEIIEDPMTEAVAERLEAAEQVDRGGESSQSKR